MKKGKKGLIFPESVKPLLEHLVHYGEVSGEEARMFKASDGIVFLEAGGYLFRRGESWAFTERFLGPLPVPNLTELTRKIFFSHHGYQRYLTTIVAEEITRRGLEGAMSQVEGWLINDLAHLVAELNAILDEIQLRLPQSRMKTGKKTREEYKRTAFSRVDLKQLSPGNIMKAFRQYIEEIQADEGIDFEVWNKELLGVSGNQEALFQAIMARKALRRQGSAIST